MTDPIGTRTLDRQLCKSSTLPAQLLGHAFKSLLKGKLYTGTAPLFPNVYRRGSSQLHQNMHFIGCSERNDKRGELFPVLLRPINPQYTSILDWPPSPKLIIYILLRNFQIS